MPSNHILINNAMEYFVVDSQMGELIDWLDKNAHPSNKDSETQQENDVPQQSSGAM